MTLIEIKNCTECRDLETFRDYTVDSFETCVGGRCRLKKTPKRWSNGRDVFCYHDPFDKMPDVPDWCPKRPKKRSGQ